MKNQVLIKVFFAIILAILAGWLTGVDQTLFGVPYVQFYQLIGQLFLNALNLVVVPLVCASIITGTARMGGEQSFGKLGAKTFGFYILTSFLAILVGVFFTLWISPGSSQEHLAQFASTIESDKISSIAAQSSEGAFEKLSQILYRLVPSNILSVASQGQMLGLIGFSLLFGFFISKIDEKPGSIILGFWQGIFQIMMRITQLVMKALPIGVFGLVAKVVATTGFQAASSVALFTLTILLGLLAFTLIVLPLMLFFIAKVNPIAHYRAMAPALFTAFSTSSSAAALPATIDCVEKRVGMSNRICSFTIPLGTSLSMSGSALYQCAASLFIAQVYGVELTFATVSLVSFVALLTAIGVAGIPSACLISVVVILNILGVPAEGVGLVLAVERILDMCRTSVNVLGNTCCATFVARLEGEELLTQIEQPLPKAG